jgi:hypothetical protein
MAATPSTASPASWKPAVPPPPVTGAAVGIGLNEGVGAGLSEGVGLGLADADGVGDALAEALSLAEPLAEGERIDTDADGLPVPVPVPVPVQAESATQASTVIRPQPTAVCRTRRAVHPMALSVLIDPSSCSRQ